MARVVISADGIKIAKPGFDANTASEADLLFSPAGATLSIYMTGRVAAGPMQDAPSGVPSIFDDRYARSVVNFGKTFDLPPIVLFGGIRPGGALDLPGIAYFSGAVSGGVSWWAWEPDWYAAVSTTQLQIWTRKSYSWVSEYAYCILENTLP